MRAGEVAACADMQGAPAKVLGEDDGGRAAGAPDIGARGVRSVTATRSFCLTTFLTSSNLGVARGGSATNGLCSHHRTHHGWIVPRPLARGARADWRPSHRGNPPRTNFAATKDGGVVQYYENVALIYLPDEAPENQVQLLDLGRQALEEARSAGASRALDRALERSVCAPATAGACVTVVASGHTVRGPFLDRWQTGETARAGSPAHRVIHRARRNARPVLRKRNVAPNRDWRSRTVAAGPCRGQTREARRGADRAAAGRPVYDEALFIPPPDATPVDEGDATGHSDPDRSRAPGKRSWSPSRLRRCGPTRKASW